MRDILAARPVEFWVAAITATTVVTVGVEQGILLAVVISMIAHIRHSYRPSDRLVTFEDGQAKLHPLDSGEQATPGLLVYHFGANLYYANAESFKEEVLCLVGEASPKATVLALESSAIGDIDYTAADMLRRLVQALRDRGVTFAVVGMEDHPLEELTTSKLVDLIGEKNIYAGLRDLIGEYEQPTPAQR